MKIKLVVLKFQYSFDLKQMCGKNELNKTYFVLYSLYI